MSKLVFRVYLYVFIGRATSRVNLHGVSRRLEVPRWIE